LQYDISSFSECNTTSDLKLQFLEIHLDKTTLALAAGYDAVCIFVNDVCDAEVLEGLAKLGVVSELI
jgi:D-lactate dehydrogenase